MTLTTIESWLLALVALLLFACIGWLGSLAKKDASIVDSMWSLMFLLAAVIYSCLGDGGLRSNFILLLVAVWAVRLSGYLTWRNWGAGEDYRYQEMRRKHSPNFELKSIYRVFGLQAVLAWFISLPLLSAVTAEESVNILDLAGLILWAIGFLFEAIADIQLAKFKSHEANNDQVLRSGLWKLTRHPNYFGNFCIWWAFYLFALSAGGWWSILSPLLMSFLLLKVSGVAMLEKDIGKRRPEYADYVSTTNAFFPGPQKLSSD